MHGYSKDPVIIKKISLKIWHLRDEIEVVLKEKLKENPEIQDDLLIKDLVNEYTEIKKVTGPRAVPDEAPAEENAEIPPETDEANSEPSETIISQRQPEIPPDKITHAKTILGEISMENMYIFCDHKYIIGNSLVIEFQIPQKFSLTADVLSCREFSMGSRIISDNKLPYRAYIKFSFLRKGERTLLRNFLSSVAPAKVSQTKKEDDKKEEKESEEFDELDNLDL